MVTNKRLQMCTIKYLQSKCMKRSFHYSKYNTTIVGNGSEKKSKKYRLQTKYIYLLRAIYKSVAFFYNDIYIHVRFYKLTI